MLSRERRGQFSFSLGVCTVGDEDRIGGNSGQWGPNYPAH